MEKAVTGRGCRPCCTVRAAAGALGLPAATRAAWPVLTVYGGCFEQVVLLGPATGLISALVMVALVHLTVRIVPAWILSGRADPRAQEVFQSVFGMVMTVLIPMKFDRFPCSACWSAAAVGGCRVRARQC